VRWNVPAWWTAHRAGILSPIAYRRLGQKAAYVRSGGSKRCTFGLRCMNMDESKPDMDKSITTSELFKPRDRT